ncbi:hypothetical protein Kpol_1039p41 [Vanderwaltozyma polyspora DSM 70294]|uniref:Leucine aminopeptidase 2 n=1 Tax=Vanderwaltozyma polyspora (strain ATCC 22028 / DSM 70294 / BCRC 21397 / CBS 2163 / NBRC 10782 / NRRL Y-8283 / UCD 57-17) TaxID=436907 RepID=LKHA4_VANPO|nr:uncharacterized protein Kpol_1039p41 [Vanderwaltozyma polyspora DSM 70294]A7THG7.1 RecName: Full=Leucine aminopeptidase 2; AltName: Full=Epoxide hydrolase; AltName: Full=Leukotriene A-4 hydrolase homolog; Short=LTA-4 hydrolase [Vanderwaltozyma polyspora DSM 70294]EDO18291.1 hypothetical protein Kpol_1039p41 [Vanderwaltozyma polyspora DSM 70294]
MLSQFTRSLSCFVKPTPPKLNKLTRTMTVLPKILQDARPKVSPELDYSTYSNYQNFKINHTDLNLNISFDDSIVNGFVTFNLNKIDKSCNEIRLDTSFLTVDSVEIDDAKVDFQLKDRLEPLGSQLIINPPTATSLNNEFNLKLGFSTTKDCTALQWLNGEQTSSGKPYVFSQLEAIHARALFPCFDTPSVKSTFNAAITSTLPVVFSGIEQSVVDNGNGTKTYNFKQSVPIPAYLIGIASGDLVSGEIGPRSKVYTEPFRLKDCEWEFSGDVEKFIQAAEKIIFPYEWGTYDILVNVNSYPYGGMESPNMTFATPTLIAYDKSNIDVIAHELAHSWSGNLVTNCSWNHFWLNEGWTVYLERRIVAAIHGEATRHFSALIGWNDLANSISAMKNPDRFSTLIQNLNDGTDPDEAFSSVPYEKGFNLLFHLETILGGPKEFDPFIKHYFTKFSKKSLDSYQFFDTLFEFFADKREILDAVDWETWLYKPGMPPKPKFITTLADNVYSLAEKWATEIKNGNTTEDDLKQAFTAADIKDFNSNQIVLFLDTLVQNKEIQWNNHHTAAKTLLKIYEDSIVKSRNAEVVFRTYRFEITAQLKESYPQLAEWLATVGRMKFVRPGYRLLNSVDRPLALATFEKLQNIYHPICKALVKQDLEA